MFLSISKSVASHIGCRILPLAKSNGINIVKLPPPLTSDILRPLDVSVFKPLKAVWRKVLNEFFRLSRFSSVGKPQFSKPLKKLHEYPDTFKKQNALSGFTKAGIFPFDKTGIDREKVQPSEVFDMPAANVSSSCYLAPNEDELDVGESSVTIKETAVSITPRKQIKQAELSHFKELLLSMTAQLGKGKRTRIQKNVVECLTEDQGKGEVSQERKKG